MIKHKIRYSFGMILMMLVGCTTTTVIPSNEYLLMNPDSVVPQVIKTQHIGVQLASVSVADYLSGNEIVLVSGDGEVHRSQRNLWAEQLAPQLHRLTLQGLAQRLPDVHWFGQQHPTSSPLPKLSIEVDMFYADLVGKIHIAGRWQLLSASGKLLSANAFYVQDELNHDGYSAMVQALAVEWFGKVITPMTQQIATSLQTLEVNND